MLPGKVPNKGDGLGPHPQHLCCLPYLRTCELLARTKVELLDLHALKHLDVAWGSGVEGRDTGLGEMEKVPRKVLWAMPCGISACLLFPILTPPTIPHP